MSWKTRCPYIVRGVDFRQSPRNISMLGSVAGLMGDGSRPSCRPCGGAGVCAPRPGPRPRGVVGVCANDAPVKKRAAKITQYFCRTLRIITPNRTYQARFTGELSKKAPFV